MKQKRSMDEALTAAKELRKNMTPQKPQEQPESDSHLKVVDSATAGSKSQSGGTPTNAVAPEPSQNSADSPLIATPKPIWVRHTIGLRDTTSLSLRDAADGQKRKERHGQLGVGEPANEQEIADLGIALALKQLGYSTL